MPLFVFLNNFKINSLRTFKNSSVSIGVPSSRLPMKLGILHSLAIQSVIQCTYRKAPIGSLVKMQNLRPHTTPTNQESVF